MYDRDELRRGFQELITPAVRRLNRIGVRPTHITLAGLVLTILACFAYLKSNYVATFVFMIIARFGDAIDGGYARLTGHVTDFGGFLDSLTDRYGEFVIVGTILYAYREVSALYYFSFAVFLGISLMSYTRALYHRYGIRCPSNPFEYLERGISMGVFFLAGRLDLWLIVIGVGTNAAVLHRIFRFSRASRTDEDGPIGTAP